MNKYNNDIVNLEELRIQLISDYANELLYVQRNRDIDLKLFDFHDEFDDDVTYFQIVNRIQEIINILEDCPLDKVINYNY